MFELALAALPALEPPSWLVDDLVVALERRVRRGLCPADLRLADLGVPEPAVQDQGVLHHPPSTTVAPAGDPEEARA